ncbi:MAG: ATP-dependent protease LonB [Candidatus Methanomethylophilus sp.]|jgi:Lon-like ATP-dependent protease|nr:ATP-dependent protease LonB [Methanomethylophilus sp.]MCI2074419.1 ATP-dependent protease LonB [Methanomethylophilus sp.]MCI2092784.1 ATP-dependent protease LonB [Methanomethylophilus sp.]
MAGRNNDGFGTFRAEDGGDAIESRDEKDPVLADVPVEEWIEKQTFASTKDIPIPDKMADRVIGQDRAVEVMKKAAAQKRHMMLIGEPGTGKSMLANSMTEYLPKDELQDIVAYANPEDENEPRIRVFPAGRGKQIVQQQKAAASAHDNQKKTSHLYACAAIVILGLLGTLMFANYYILFISLFAVMIILLFARNPMAPRNDINNAPKLLVGHDAGEKPPFVDATGTHSGALLGDVLHDPYQSGGLGTPAHSRLEAGDIHRANKGVLFIDEINTLRMESQQSLLTAMQEHKMAITGQSERSSGALVKSEPVPCDFVLVCAGNLDAMKGMHPALRSRIRGYGYEVYMRNTMPDTDEHRADICRFVAQEVRKDGKIPPFDKYAVGEIIKEAQRRAGRKGRLTLRFRELGGLIRAAGDVAVARGAEVTTFTDVDSAKINARSLEQQIADRQIEASKAYQLFNTTGTAVGQINGLAALDPGTGMAEYSGIMLPIVAEVTPAAHKDGGRIIATGKLGEIAKEAVENITAVIKNFSSRNISEVDIHLEYIGTYDGVEGDSASITMTTVILSALENIPIRQDLAMTGSLNVRGKVLPVGAVTAKLEAAASAGIKTALIPYDNIKDVMIRSRFYKTMEVFGVRTYRDVAELAFADCPAKTMLLQRLDVLNPDGPSYEKVQPPVQYEAHAQAAAEPSPSAADAPQAPAADAPQQEGVQSAGER